MTIEIPLTRGYVTVIDDEDWVLVGGCKWSAQVVPHRNTVYANATVNGKATTLHALLAPDWAEVDHVDGDGLNNRRSNLRDGAGFRNKANRGVQSNSTSGFKGVSRRRGGKWGAFIKVNRKQIYLGVYDTPEEAADVYDQAAISHFGEYAKTNAMLRQAPGTGPRAWRHRPPDERELPTHCLANHEYTPENTYVRPDGSRECKQCKREKQRGPSPSRPGRICLLGCACGRHRRAK